MQKQWFRYHLNLVLVLAIALMGASPACAFISGKTSLIEICTTDGVKTIPVTPDQSPAQQHDHNHSSSHSPCLFCFAVAKTKAASMSGSFKIVATTNNTPAYFFTNAALIPQQTGASYDPRGPPSIS